MHHKTNNHLFNKIINKKCKHCKECEGCKTIKCCKHDAFEWYDKCQNYKKFQQNS